MLNCFLKYLTLTLICAGAVTFFITALGLMVILIRKVFESVVN